MPFVGGMTQEDKVANEGQVTFDIRFHAVTPGMERIPLQNIKYSQTLYMGIFRERCGMICFRQ